VACSKAFFFAFQIKIILILLFEGIFVGHRSRLQIPVHKKEWNEKDTQAGGSTGSDGQTLENNIKIIMPTICYVLSQMICVIRVQCK
jgi:hypothetical protein